MFASVIPNKLVFVICIVIVVIETYYYDNFTIIICLGMPMPP